MSQVANYKTGLLVLVLAAFALSGVGPYDRFTWLLEVAPVIIGVPVLLATARRFPLSLLLYSLLALHALVLIVGGHYTYAKVPLGYWMQDWLHWDRNPYDRLGHLMQGFVPAILAREILIRRSVVKRGVWLFVIVTSICLAFSAFYELLEWWTAAATGTAAEAFLGTQGDEWDSQWDMFLALVGSVASQLLLSRLHDRQLRC